MYFYDALQRSRKTRSVEKATSKDLLMTSSSKDDLHKSDSYTKLPSINPRIRKLREAIRKHGKIEDGHFSSFCNSSKNQLKRAPSLTGCLSSQILKGSMRFDSPNKKKSYKIQVRLPSLISNFSTALEKLPHN